MRFAAFAGAAALAIGILTAASAGPAAASVEYGGLSLANAPAYGMYAAQGVTADSSVAVNTGYPARWGIAVLGPQETLGNPKVTGYPEEFHAITTKGTLTNWCIVGNAEYGDAYLASCGANGTVFIVVFNGDGVLLYSRYFLDSGSDWVLAVYSPSPGDPVMTIPYNAVGGNWFGRWDNP